MGDAAPFLSCAPETLYAGQDWKDALVGLDALAETARRHRGAIAVVAEVFPGLAVDRAQPEHLAGPDPDFVRDVANYFINIDRYVRHVSPVLLVRIPRAILWNNVLFAALPAGGALPVYEFCRPPDRGAKGDDLAARLAACPQRARLDLEGASALFVGSAGSYNYGHWLVDDLPSLAALPSLPRAPRRAIVMTGYEYGAINGVRSQGTSLALRGADRASIHYVSPEIAYTVENLHAVTPVSYHPERKHPRALDYLRGLFRAAAASLPDRAGPERLLVRRPEGWGRGLANAAAVEPLLEARGFCPFVPEGRPLLEQWAAFAGAREIVGVMGAAMTSSLFAPPGARVTHLAASGWMEPFFWDLAAMGGQRYAAVFGAPEPSDEALYRRAFSVEPERLAAALDGG